MKVSIIVPVYNVEEYLPECVTSVLLQSYQDYELILIDDESTDDSGKLCDLYSTECPDKIKVFHIPNAGPLYARIYGMKYASGDVLIFLDSDDGLRADALEKIVDSFRDGCDMILFNAEMTEDFLSKRIVYSLNDGQVFEGKTKEVMYRKTVEGSIPNSVCLKAIRRKRASIPEFLEQFGKVKYGEDLLLSACFITDCAKIYYLNEGLYRYRIRPGSAVHSFDIQRKESIKIVHTELEKCIDQWGMPELKPLHNLRKVRGWIETLEMLLRNKNTMSNAEFQNQLESMAVDPYFLTAYSNMNRSRLSRRNQILASCLAKKHFLLLRAYGTVVRGVSKLKSGR